MKHWIAASALLATLSLSAQKHQHQELSPEQRATLKSKEMALHLDLTTNQQQQVQKRLVAEFTEAQKMREARQDTDKSERDRFELRNAQLDRQLALKADMKKILSEEQYSLWQKYQQRRMAKRSHRSREGRDGERRMRSHPRQ